MKGHLSLKIFNFIQTKISKTKIFFNLLLFIKFKKKIHIFVDKLGYL